MRHGIRLGVDVGTVRVGIARSDPDGILATPVATLARAHAQAAAAEDPDVARIGALAHELSAIEVVVGLPLGLAGTQGASAEQARQYAAVLAQLLEDTSVRLVDERLTTVEAHRALRASGVPARGARSVVDQVAAVMILQAALDEERTTGRPPGRDVRDPRRKPRRRRATTP